MGVRVSELQGPAKTKKIPHTAKNLHEEERITCHHAANLEPAACERNR